jgi:hypothetical protein
MQNFREKNVTQKERNMIPKIVDNLFRSNAQGQRMHFAKTNLVATALPCSVELSED